MTTVAGLALGFGFARNHISMWAVLETVCDAVQLGTTARAVPLLPPHLIPLTVAPSLETPTSSMVLLPLGVSPLRVPVVVVKCAAVARDWNITAAFAMPGRARAAKRSTKVVAVRVRFIAASLPIRLIR
jgi:hypothetical protein